MDFPLVVTSHREDLRVRGSGFNLKGGAMATLKRTPETELGDCPGG
jgi:hypothetical protein